MAILSAEATKYLKENFGTAIAHNCKNCKLYSECSKRINRSNYCKLTNYADLFMIKELYNHSCDENVNGIYNLIFKLNMLGFKQTVDGPWVILKHPEGRGEAWINPGLRVYNSNIFNKITRHGRFLICTMENKIEIYSEVNPSKNIMEGKPDISDSVSINRYANGEDICCLNFKYQSAPGVLLVDNHGNGVICLGLKNAYIMAHKGHYVLEGAKNEGFVILTKELKIKNKSGHLMTLEL